MPARRRVRAGRLRARGARRRDARLRRPRLGPGRWRPPRCRPDAGAPDAGCGALAACADGCADTSSDPRHCGGCARSCGVGQVCRQGACATPTCTSGAGCRLTDGGSAWCCNGVCSELGIDPLNCGQCGARCPSGTCAGNCAVGCDGGGCPAGTACGTDGFRQRSACHTTSCSGLADRTTCSLRPGEVGECCAGTCIDYDSNPAHCGACGRACSASQLCVAGSCQTNTSCATGPVNSSCALDAGFGLCCGGACSALDIRTDANNCGWGLRAALPHRRALQERRLRSARRRRGAVHPLDPLRGRPGLPRGLPVRRRHLHRREPASALRPQRQPVLRRGVHRRLARQQPLRAVRARVRRRPVSCELGVCRPAPVCGLTNNGQTCPLGSARLGSRCCWARASTSPATPRTVRGATPSARAATSAVKAAAGRPTLGTPAERQSPRAPRAARARRAPVCPPPAPRARAEQLRVRHGLHRPDLRCADHRPVLPGPVRRSPAGPPALQRLRHAVRLGPLPAAGVPVERRGLPACGQRVHDALPPGRELRGHPLHRVAVQRLEPVLQGGRIHRAALRLSQLAVCQPADRPGQLRRLRHLVRHRGGLPERPVHHLRGAVRGGAAGVVLRSRRRSGPAVLPRGGLRRHLARRRQLRPLRRALRLRAELRGGPGAWR